MSTFALLEVRLSEYASIINPVLGPPLLKKNYPCGVSPSDKRPRESLKDSAIRFLSRVCSNLSSLAPVRDEHCRLLRRGFNSLSTAAAASPRAAVRHVLNAPGTLPANCFCRRVFCSDFSRITSSFRGGGGGGDGSDGLCFLF